MVNTDISPITSLFPYELTGAQKRSIAEICADMESEKPMRRILCGDVGSGKTAVAAVAAYAAAANGFQCALMAPTEILAKQHYADLAPLFEKLGLGCTLLCGSMTQKEKKEAKELISGGVASLVIGTHALISDGVEFESLGLVITDEQHRFGVNQRAALQDKASCAHNLVMSATPIPRTLSLVIYGDLDVSRLDEMPPGRKKVSTFRVDESYRARLLGFMEKQAAEGHSTYVVCPAIEENEKKKGEDAEELYDIIFGLANEPEPPMKAAVQFAAELKEKLPKLNIGFIHGKMKTAEKDSAMDSFAKGETDVLVSTTVIEVGVNVPRATLMVIENAERFGLSQLHQLRGRVGRGSDKSYCILVSDTKNETSLARLDAMCRLSDGFAVAEEDLRLRGPGDFFAVGGAFRQHGSSDLHFASSLSDGVLIESAQESARSLISLDPNLEMEEHKLLRDKVASMLEKSENTIS